MTQGHGCGRMPLADPSRCLPSFCPILFCLTPHSRRLGVLKLQPVGRTNRPVPRTKHEFNNTPTGYGYHSGIMRWSRQHARRPAMAQRSPWRVSQQLRADHGSGVRCSRPGQHQRVLPLLAGVPLPLSQDGAGHAEAAMEFAIESETVKGTAIDFLRLCLADRTTNHFLNAHLLGAQNIGSCSPT